MVDVEIVIKKNHLNEAHGGPHKITSRFTKDLRGQQHVNVMSAVDD